MKSWIITSNLFKPDSNSKIALHILFIFLFIISVVNLLINEFTMISLLSVLIMFIIALITYLKLLAQYFITRYFQKYNDKFSQTFSKGFKIIFASGLASMIYNAIIIFTFSSYSSLLTSGNLETNMAILSWTQDIIIIVLGIYSLYGFYVLISGLKHYTPQN